MKDLDFDKFEPLQSFEYGGLRIETFYQGNEYLPNRVYLNGKLIHTDNSFRPSPLHCIDSIDTMVSLIDFYTLTRDAVEDDYFIARGCKKLDRYSDTLEAEDIRLMCYDWEERELGLPDGDNSIDMERISQYIKDI